MRARARAHTHTHTHTAFKVTIAEVIAGADAQPPSAIMGTPVVLDASQSECGKPPCTFSWQVTCLAAGEALGVTFTANTTTVNVTSGLGPPFSIDMSPPPANRSCVAVVTVTDAGYSSVANVSFEVRWGVKQPSRVWAVSQSQ